MEEFRAREKAAREANRGLWGRSEAIDGKDTKGEVIITNSGTKCHADGCKFLAQ